MLPILLLLFIHIRCVRVARDRPASPFSRIAEYNSRHQAKFKLKKIIFEFFYIFEILFLKM